jgi:hypothetical protein
MKNSAIELKALKAPWRAGMTIGIGLEEGVFR